MYYLFSKRPTLQYDGLHDRALKHYFSLPEVRVRLTKMDLVSSSNRNLSNIKKQMQGPAIFNKGVPNQGYRVVPTICPNSTCSNVFIVKKTRGVAPGIRHCKCFIKIIFKMLKLLT